ncbi:MAG TPA: hypothetical protein VMT09_12285 [Steroidobacteraceae bacterium]|nr:hypothetical protein [Steroidobacteraceae bacterium]
MSAAVTPGHRISSRATVYYKRILPLVFLVAIVGFPLIAFQAASRTGRPLPWPALLAPLLMGAIVLTLLRRLVFDLADEVTDTGDALRVRFGQDEERIALGEIVNVSYSPFINPPRVTLTLRHPGRFGREVSFMLPLRFLGAFAGRNPTVDELIARVDAARRR